MSRRLLAIRSTHFHLAVILRLGLGLTLGVFGGCHSKKPAGPPPPMPVELATVTNHQVEDTSEYVATLKSRRAVELRPQVAGWITQIYVRSGDRAKAGARLFQIDPRQQRASVESAQATRHALQASLTYAERSYERTQALFQKGFVSHDDLDHARAALDSARADWNAQGQQVRQQQVALGYFLVNAPEAGVVGDIPVRVGDLVSAQTVLTTLDENRRLEIYIGIPSERSSDLALGLTVELLDPSGKTVASAPIDFISPRIDDATQSILVKCDLENPTVPLRTDQLLRARVIWGRRTVPLLPVTAVTRLGGQAFVFVAVSENGGLVAHRFPVELGAIVGQSYVVEKGLKDGDRAIVSGLQKLVDGARVTPKS